MKKRTNRQQRRANMLAERKATVRVATTIYDALIASTGAIQMYRGNYDANDHPAIDAVQELMFTLLVCVDTPTFDSETSQLHERLKGEIANVDLSAVREARGLQGPPGRDRNAE